MGIIPHSSLERWIVRFISEENEPKMYHCALNENDFFKIYHPTQNGGTVGLDGSSYYQASYLGRQRGRGLFGFLGKRFLPWVGKYIWPHAKKAIANTAVQVLDQNRPWREALKDNGMQALKGAGNDILNQSGSGIRRGRKRKAYKKKISKIKKRKISKKPKRSKKTLKKRTKKTKKRKQQQRIRSIFDLK
jgi:hypothetical protein